MSLFDPTGDLSQFEDLTNFGQLENNVIHFFVFGLFEIILA